MAKRKKKKSSRIFLKVSIALFVLFCLGVAGIIGVFYIVSKDLPQIFHFDDYKPKQVSRLYDANGNVLAEFYEEKRTVIPMAEIPQVMRDAILSAEDADFYSHKGLDYFGMFRALAISLKRGSFAQGASTITQQVVKNLLLTPEKHLKRKFQEIMLARQLETSLTKDEILAIYLNHIYLGHRINGIEEASLFYFSKHAKDMTAGEAAILAGIVQSPERYSPYKHPKATLARRNYVIRQMRDKGKIGESEYHALLKEEIKVKKPEHPMLNKAPYFSEHVKQMLIDRFGRDYVYTAGLRIRTTLDPDAQSAADKALQEGLYAFDERRYLNRALKNPSKKEPKSYKIGTNCEAKIVSSSADGAVKVSIAGKELPLKYDKRSLKTLKADEVFVPGATWFVRPTALDKAGHPDGVEIPAGANGALMAINPDNHHVVALSGGFDFSTSSFNRATQAKRQTGSSFKTFVYAAGIEYNLIMPATIIDDAPKVFSIPGKAKPWSPQNSDKKFLGPMTVRVALAKSRNTVAVDVLERVGIDKTVDFVKKFGIKSDLTQNFTLALGSSEMTLSEATNAYATFANGCSYAEPVYITEIRKGKEVLPLPRDESHRACNPQTAFLITTMLHSVGTEGTARGKLGKWKHYVGGKTGTTNETKDAWFVGYSRYLATGVYVGYDDPKSLGKGEGGGSTALPIWESFMRQYHADKAIKTFDKPDFIVEARVDKATGLLSDDPKTSYTEFFPAGKEPKEYVDSNQRLSDSAWILNQFENQDIEEQTDEVDSF